MKIKNWQIKFLNYYILSVTILVIIVFTFVNPLHQVFSYDIKCDRFQDSCNITIHNTNITVKHFKLSEIERLENKSFYLPSRSRHNRSSFHMLFITKKNGRQIYAQGFISSRSTDKDFQKFNNFLNSGDNFLEFTHDNSGNNALNFYIIIGLLIAAILMALRLGRDIHDYSSYGEAKELITKQNIVCLTIFSIIVIPAIISNINFWISQNKEPDFYPYCDIYSERLFQGKSQIFTDIMPDFNDISNEDLKNIYYSTIDHMVDLKYYDSLLNYDNELKILHYDLMKKDVPVCIQDMKFYAQNQCLKEDECYMDVSSVPYKYPDSPKVSYRYYFQFLKDKSSSDIQYFKIIRLKKENTTP